MFITVDPQIPYTDCETTKRLWCLLSLNQTEHDFPMRASTARKFLLKSSNLTLLYKEFHIESLANGNLSWHIFG